MSIWTQFLILMWICICVLLTIQHCRICQDTWSPCLDISMLITNSSTSWSISLKVNLESTFIKKKHYYPQIFIIFMTVYRKNDQISYTMRSCWVKIDKTRVQIILKVVLSDSNRKIAQVLKNLNWDHIAMYIKYM